jgi:NAD-dependent deacetylase
MSFRMTQEDLQTAARLLYDAQRVAVLTGAGVSKESGVPTFRDAVDGLWAKYDPMQLATSEAFQRDPKLVWEWYEYRRDLIRPTQPNNGHIALAQIEKYAPEFLLITQNVDDLHERAGSRRIVHLHGKIAENKCFANCLGAPTLIKQDRPDLSEAPPRCPHCGGYVRPNVVWFGEVLPHDALAEAVDFCETCDVMLVVGTSGVVQPAASLSNIARHAGAIVIEVNPDTAAFSPWADVRLAHPSGVILPQIVSLMQQFQRSL